MSDNQETEETQQPVAQDLWPDVVDLIIELPGNKKIVLPEVSSGETLSAIRQALADFQETAFVTSFKWELKGMVDIQGNQVEVAQEFLNDFTELNTFLQPNIKSCLFKIAEEQYDVKKVKAHVKRLKDISRRNFLISAAPKDAKKDKKSGPETNETEEKTTKKESKPEPLPKFEKLLEPSLLGNFFQKVFAEPGKPADNKPAVASEPLNSVIKSVFVSGWNPPPSNRRLQGDLLYVEVVLASEGTVYLTATSRGFYVNRSNRTTFDPRPANNPHFAHTLFQTLLSFSSNLRTAWTNLCTYSEQHQFSSGPLSQLETQFQNFQGDVNTLPPNTWLMNPEIKNQSSYDLFRAQEHLSDLLGADELGAPREWNDEIQSIRSLPASELGEKIVKARLEHRIITDFTENCKKIAVGISEGLIAPLTYADPSQSNIYVYNGIFVSRAEDTKDLFKMCEGEEASRKQTSRDMNSQKLIKALEIEGLGTVLCTIVDYKGVRYVGQSIIPGIFQQGENSASLMYGVLEPNKNITVKNSTLKVYQDLAAKLYLGERNIPVQPFKNVESSEEVKAEEVEDDSHIDPLNKLLKAADSNQSPPIKVDEVDNVPVDEAKQSIKHIGPVESKIIKGSDGRLYAIEFMRLTPRDANYVEGEKGTQKVAADLLAKGDASLFPTYLLRQELVNLFVHRKINVARQNLILEAVGKEKALKKSSEEEGEKKSEEKTTPSDVDAHLDDASAPMEIVKEENTDKQKEIDEELQNSLATEYADKFKAITPQSLGIEINPNVFFPVDADVDPEVVAKDENLVREMSTFLMESVIPMVTKQIREGEFFPRDCQSMVNYLHRMGVNLRYLGQLANLAQAQEKEDADLMLQGRQRVHAMPYYWLEFLLVEMLARSVKHVLNGKLRSDPFIASSPATTIAALLNHVLSILPKDPSATSANNNNNNNNQKKEEAPAPTNNNNNNTNSDKKKKKKGGKGNKNNKHEGDNNENELSNYNFNETQGQVNGFESRQETLQELSKILIERFLYEYSVLNEAIDPSTAPDLNIDENSSDEQKSKAIFHAMIRNRLSPTMLLHRISQQCGLVINAKNYNFKGENPISPEDIIGLIPKVKSCEPESYLNEFTEILNSSSNFVSQGNTMAAFEYAQQAVNIITQITGPDHPHAFQATDQLSAVLINSSADIKSSIQMASRALFLAALNYGIDSQETILHCLQLGILYSEINMIDVAINYYLVAKYLLQLIGGQNHPEITNIFMRLATLYEKVNDLESSLQCLFHARAYTSDLLKNCLLTISIASMYFHYNKVHEAVAHQKTGYRILKELVKENDERLIEVKKNLEVYLRASIGVPPPTSNGLSMSNLHLHGADSETEGLVGDGSPDAKPSNNNNKKKKNNKKGKK